MAILFNLGQLTGATFNRMEENQKHRNTMALQPIVWVFSALAERFPVLNASCLQLHKPMQPVLVTATVILLPREV